MAGPARRRITVFGPAAPDNAAINEIRTDLDALLKAFASIFYFGSVSKPY
jgi:hypothetical protein